MLAPFDIAADLDTPVSAYLKLGRLRPRFLLESVEGGERVARYSFAGVDPFRIVEIRESRQDLKAAQQQMDALRDALRQGEGPDS